jgi:Condensation domain
MARSSLASESVTLKAYPLSLMQERVILGRAALKMAGRQAEPSILSLCIEIQGHLNLRALCDALQSIAQRHSALRIQIAPNPEIPDTERARRIAQSVRSGIQASGLYIQRVLDQQEISLQIHDASNGQLDDVVRELLSVEAATPFNDEIPLRFRVNLVRGSETSNILIVTIDHMVSDGRSLNIFQREVEQLYEHFAFSSAPPEEPGIGYVEFTEQEVLAQTLSEFDPDLDYWDGHWRKFCGARLGPLDLPFAEPSSRRSTTFATQRLSICDADTLAFRSAAQQARVTPYVFFLGVFLTVLRLYIGRDNLALWVHCANRSPKTLNSIGLYIHTHLMGFVVSPSGTARELLAQVAQRHLETMKHARMPLPLLWQSLHCSPRFADAGIMLDYLTDEPQPEWRPGKVTFRKVRVAPPHPDRGARLSVVVMDYGKTLSIRCDHVVSLYSASAVETMLQDMLHIATSFAADPDQPLVSLRIPMKWGTDSGASGAASR